MNNPTPLLEAQLPGAGRRLAALIYETLPVLAIVFFATIPAMLLTTGESVPVGHWGYRLWLLSAIAAYFVSGWLRGGQTIAAKAWRLRVVNENGDGLLPSQALLRFAVALLGWVPLGLGHWWGWFEPQRRSWHDLAAGTRLVYLPKGQRKMSADGRR